MTDRDHERRRLPMTNEQIDALAKKLSEQLGDQLADQIAAQAYQRFAVYIGKSVLRNSLFLVFVLGAVIAAAWKVFKSGGH